MGNGKDGTREELVEEMISFIREHDELYHHLDVGLCLHRVRETYALVQGKVEPVPRLDEVPPETTLDYGHTILTRFHLPLADFQEPFRNALLHGEIEHPKFGQVAYEGELEAHAERALSSYRKESGRSYGQVSSRWPYYYTVVRTQSPSHVPSALVRPGLPLYPDWYTGSHSFLGIGDAASDASNAYGLFVLIPDPRARIERLVLEGETVRVALGEGGSAFGDLLLKLYASRDEVEKDVELPLKGPEVRHQFPFEPELVSVHLITRESGEDLDSRDFRLAWGHLPAGVKIKRTGEHLTELLRSGEGPNIEYKRQSDDPKLPQKVSRTVAAFANTSGGVLFLGVDDMGVPVQSVDPKEADRIRDILHSYIDPPPETLEFQSVKTDEVTILAVLVEEGKGKPYVVRDQGTFVRHGATTRQATRSELVELLKDSSSPYGFR